MAEDRTFGDTTNEPVLKLMACGQMVVLSHEDGIKKIGLIHALARRRLRQSDHDQDMELEHPGPIPFAYLVLMKEVLPMMESWTT